MTQCGTRFLGRLAFGLALALGLGVPARPARAAPDLQAEAADAARSSDLGHAFALARQAIEAGTDRPETAYRLLVETARDAGRLGEAETYVRGRLQGGRDLSTAAWALGLVHYARSEWSAAIPLFERALTLNPGELAPYLDLVECHLALGDRRLDWLDAVRARVGHNWAEITARAEALDATGRTREALALYDEAVRFQPSEPQIPRLAAIAHARLGEIGEAEGLLDRAARLAQAPERARTEPITAARTLAAIELARARLDLQASRLDRALDSLARARARAGEAADRSALAQALILEGLARAAGSDPEAARRPALEGLRLARRIGDERTERDALAALAVVELNTFQTRSASERLKTALARATESGDSRGMEAALALLGLVTLARGEYLEALPYFNEASERARDSGATLVQQEALEGASRALLQLSEHREALDLALDALALADELDFPAGGCQSHLTAGRAATQLGLYDQADFHLQRAAELAGRHGLVRQEGSAYLHLGQVAAALGQAEMAQGWFQQALALARKAHDPALEADGVSAIGEGFLELGAYDEALRQFERALVLATESGYLEGRLENLTRAAEVHKLLGDSRRSIALFKEALRISSGLKNRVSQAVNYAHLGEIYAALGDFNKSLGYLNRALRTNREIGSVRGEGECLLSICRAYNVAGSYEAAVGRGGEALAFAEAHGNQAQRASAAIEMGNAYLGLGRADRAEPYFRSSHDMARTLDRPSLQWPAAAGMARALAAQGKSEPAIKLGREAVDTLERLRGDLDLPEMRASFLEDKLEPYEELVLLLVRQGLYAEAFRTMEYSRSRTFLEILTDEDGAVSDRLAELRRKNQEMKREILRRTEDLAVLPATADRDSATAAVLRALRELRQKHDELRATIEHELPEGSVALGATPLTLAEVQGMLDPESAVLEYYVTRNELVIFLITHDGVRAVTRPESEAHLAARVKLLRASLGGDSSAPHDAHDWQPPAGALTAALLDPIRSDPLLAGRDRLIVVPHKFLHYVPFQALVTGSGQAGRPHFLVEDFEVSYAPSASVLKHCVDRARGRRRTLLAVANAVPRDLRGRELLYVGEEVQSIKRRFGNGAVVRIGRDATETVVKEEAGKFDLIHFAVHSEVDPHDPLHSYLDLAASPGDDGRLDVGEVMGLGVDADLVVLSGCSTAAGAGQVDRVPDGDDWVGLTRAFIYAGAPSVVATLWPVNDRSTSHFMERFYELLPAMPKSEALARTQREMIAGLIPGAAECADPYYWAPFVLIGAAN